MATKYPIILVHGIALKDFLFLKAFGRIEAILREAGHEVYTSRIDGFGTTDTNSEQLYREISEIIERTGCERVNIIAHSKGGLDSKKMILRYSMEDRVASLTTLCTPHKGSPVASGILKFPKFSLKFVGFWINFWYRLSGDKQPNSYEVCRELALIDSVEESTRDFSDRVFCQSYSTTLEKSTDDFVMGIPLMFSHYFENGKASDGMVSSESSEFGEYKGRVEGSISHSEIVDFMAKKSKEEKIFGFYTGLCAELEKKGF